MDKSIKINAHTCQICGRYTNWESSFGSTEFIVCGPCFAKLGETYGEKSLEIIFKIAEIREEKGLTPKLEL